MLLKCSLALAFFFAVALPVRAQFVDSGKSAGPQMNPVESTATTEELSRKLIDLKAQRDAMAATDGKDSDPYKELDAQVTQLRQQIAGGGLAIVNSNNGNNNGGNIFNNSDSVVAAMPTYPRIVPAAPPAMDVPVPVSAVTAPVATVLSDTGTWAGDPPADQAVRARLAQATVTINANAIGLEKVFDSFRNQAGVNLNVNWKVLEGVGLEKETPVSIGLREVDANTALRTLLALPSFAVNLAFTTKDGALVVSTKDDLSSSAYQSVRMYNVSDLLAIPAGFQLSPEQLSRAYENRITILCQALQTMVAPDSWRDNGGTIGSIQVLDGVLIINQSSENHHAIEQFLAQFRAIRNR